MNIFTNETLCCLNLLAVEQLRLHLLKLHRCSYTISKREEIVSKLIEKESVHKAILKKIEINKEYPPSSIQFSTRLQCLVNLSLIEDLLAWYNNRLTADTTDFEAFRTLFKHDPHFKAHTVTGPMFFDSPTSFARRFIKDLYFSYENYNERERRDFRLACFNYLIFFYKNVTSDIYSDPCCLCKRDDLLTGLRSDECNCFSVNLEAENSVLSVIDSFHRLYTVLTGIRCCAAHKTKFDNKLKILKDI